MFTEQKSSDVFARTQQTSCQWSDKRSDGLSGKQSFVFSPPPTCSESKTTACRSMTGPESWRPLFVCQRGGRRRGRLVELREKIHQFAFRTDRDSGEFQRALKHQTKHSLLNLRAERRLRTMWASKRSVNVTLSKWPQSRYSSFVKLGLGGIQG